MSKKTTVHAKTKGYRVDEKGNVFTSKGRKRKLHAPVRYGMSANDII